MTTSDKFCLKWKEFQKNISTTFETLRNDNAFSDVTLSCEDGQDIEAHKVILAASSPFFQILLKRTKNAHPLIYMRGIKSVDLVAIIDFLYHGEANIFQENLDSFLAIAEELKLKGLTGETDVNKQDQYAKKSSIRKQTKFNDQKQMPQNAENSNYNEQPKNMSFFQYDQEQSDVVLSENETHFDTDLVRVIVNQHEEFTGDLKELGEEVKTMYSLSKQEGQNYYTCHVCGKQVPSYNLRTIQNHIEAKHMHGISLPCSFCQKTFGSSNSLRAHISKFHK